MRHFPLYQSHLDFTKQLWERLLKQGDLVIDATCGNGHDALFLAALLEKQGGGQLTVIDIQKAAIDATTKKLDQYLSPTSQVKILICQQSHSTLPKEGGSPKLVVYNLGYLPSGDKEVTTQVESTLESIKNCLSTLREGGVISITCYPGHNEGAKEEKAITELLSTLDPAEWSVSHLTFHNRKKAPSVVLVQKELYIKY